MWAHNAYQINDQKYRDGYDAIFGKQDATPRVVNEQTIRAALKGATLKPGQQGASIPAVERYVRRLEAGETPPPIKVDEGRIVDGHHRYIAGRVFGQEPPTTPGGRINPKVDSWDAFRLDPTDWGNR